MSDGAHTTIDGLHVEMMDCDGSLNCFIEHKSGCSASLAMAAGGYLQDMQGNDAYGISASTYEKIEEWALAHGY